MTTNPQVRIVAASIALAEYKSFGVYMCQANRTFQPCSHLAFYENKRIYRVIPAIRSQVESVTLFDEEAVEKRDDIDTRTKAVLIYLVQKLREANNSRALEKSTEKVTLLSGIGDPDTIILPHDIQHKQRYAFTQGHRYIARDKLLANPMTTSELL
ncbi:MAG: hypothetical protein U7123_00135 [Potamolinea sp.]